MTTLFVVSARQPVFVDLLMSHRIDSQPGGPVRQPYFSYLPAWLHRLSKSIPRSRFLGSIKVYKYGYIDWRNRFLGTDLCASFKFKNTVRHRCGWPSSYSSLRQCIHCDFPPRWFSLAFHCVVFALYFFLIVFRFFHQTATQPSPSLDAGVWQIFFLNS